MTKQIINKELLEKRSPALELWGTRLRGVKNDDIPFCFDLSMRFNTWYFWSDGQIETFEEQFTEIFRRKAETRNFFIVEKRKQDIFQPIGLAYIYSHDPVNEWAYFTIAVLPELVGRGHGYGATTLIVDMAFFHWNLYKLYIEILAINYQVLSLAKKMGFEQQGILKEHYRVSGERIDVEVLSMTREKWYSEHRARCYSSFSHRKRHEPQIKKK